MLVSIILVFILPRKLAINIAVVGKLSIYRFIPPRVAPTVTPSRRFLPLRLGRQLFPGPATIGASVIPRYPYHRVIAPRRENPNGIHDLAVVLEGLRQSSSIAEICRKHGIREKSNRKKVLF